MTKCIVSCGCVHRPEVKGHDWLSVLTKLSISINNSGSVVGCITSMSVQYEWEGLMS